MKLLLIGQSSASRSSDMLFKPALRLSGAFFIMGCEFHCSKVVALSLLEPVLNFFILPPAEYAVSC